MVSYFGMVMGGAVGNRVMSTGVLAVQEDASNVSARAAGMSRPPSCRAWCGWLHVAGLTGLGLGATAGSDAFRVHSLGARESRPPF